MANKDANVPLVLLHGLLGDSGDWQPVIDRLPAIRCIALDLPGHGQHSDLNVSDVEQSHQWLISELASRNIERYLLAGYSLGGRLALYHASREPAGLRGLLLESYYRLPHGLSFEHAAAMFGLAYRAPTTLLEFEHDYRAALKHGVTLIEIRVPSEQVADDLKALGAAIRGK